MKILESRSKCKTKTRNFSSLPNSSDMNPREVHLPQRMINPMMKILAITRDKLTKRMINSEPRIESLKISKEN